MPTAYRYSAPKRRRRKKRSPKKPIIICTAVLLVLAAAYVFCTFFYTDVKQDIDEINYPRKYSEYVEKAAADYSLDPALIYAVIHTESDFDPNAQSDAGACGIMQIMPESFTWLQQIRGCEGTYTSDDLFNPEICIDYGCYLLKYFYDRYGTERSAVAAYNAGFKVDEWLKDSSCSSDGVTLESIPYSETANYVEKVESAKAEYTRLYYS